MSDVCINLGIMKTKNYLWLLTSFVLLTVSCKKEMDVPNEEAKLLFGKWELKYISGGFSGGGKPSGEDVEMVEFSSNGVSKWYKNGKRTDKIKFTITTGESIYGSDKNVINYKRKTIFQGPASSQRIFFQAYDTLTLSDECYDCYSYTYVRVQG